MGIAQSHIKHINRRSLDLNPGGPPDFDGDGVVAVPDLLTLLVAWGACQ